MCPEGGCGAMEEHLMEGWRTLPVLSAGAQLIHFHNVRFLSVISVLW